MPMNMKTDKMNQFLGNYILPKVTQKKKKSLIVL
jgi:hypothetical protein